MPLLALSIARPLVFGIGNGAGFGLLGIGLVLIYKSTRVFNFAAGEFATIGAYGTFFLGRDHFHFPYPLAIVMGVLLATGAGLVTEVVVVRPLSNRPKVTLLVATAAVATIFIPLEEIVAGTKVFQARPVFKGLGPVILGVHVAPQLFLVLGALVGAGVLLALFFSGTDLGLATLATSQEATASELMGIRLNRISMLVWGAAGFVGGLAGVLLAPVFSSYKPGFGTTDILIPAFTAAVLGGMTSVPGAFLGGILLGVVRSMAQFNLNQVPGVEYDALLLVLILVLLIRPTGILGKEA